MFFFFFLFFAVFATTKPRVWGWRLKALIDCPLKKKKNYCGFPKSSGEEYKKAGFLKFVPVNAKVSSK